MDLTAVPAGKLIGFEAADGFALSGMLFSPRTAGADVVIFLHGNGDASIFRSGRTNVLARGLIRRGVAFLPFDNRGAGLLRWLKRSRGPHTEYRTGGVSHELIRECVEDIDGAVRLARRLGFRRIHLAGHSTGANKIVLYHSLKPRNRIASYALLAPGDDTGLYYRALGPSRFWKVLERCRREIESGRGERLTPPGWSPFPITFQSLYDTIHPDGDYNIFPFLEEIEGVNLSTRPLFRQLSTVRKRMLVAYGSEDEFCGDAGLCAEIIRSHTGAPGRVRIELFEGADHGFHGSQEELADVLASHVVAK